jgi:hypothetical protein
MPKKKKEDDEWEPFDDCAVCQAMAFAKREGREPTMEELTAAFKKAKESGAVVGGSLFE